MIRRLMTIYTMLCLVLPAGRGFAAEPRDLAAPHASIQPEILERSARQSVSQDQDQRTRTIRTHQKLAAAVLLLGSAPAWRTRPTITAALVRSPDTSTRKQRRADERAAHGRGLSAAR
ncbi:MAG: hypothetical protein ACFB6R_01480 [Alphaproteobacteria bacterium]